MRNNQQINNPLTSLLRHASQSYCEYEKLRITETVLTEETQTGRSCFCGRKLLAWLLRIWI